MKTKKQHEKPQAEAPDIPTESAPETDTATQDETKETSSTEDVGNQIASEIEGLNQEISDLRDKNLRLMAEFDNFRKRSIKERSESFQYASEEVLKKILPLVDDFDRAMQAMQSSDDVKAIREGIELIYGKFLGFLGDSGVQLIPTDNEVFNTDLHEAITTFPSASEDQKGKIIDCVSKGYTLNEKVIRYAKVVVGQ